MVAKLLRTGGTKGGVCAKTVTGVWFPDTDALPDPESATFKTKRACERWAYRESVHARIPPSSPLRL